MKNKSKIKIAAQVSPNPSEEDIAFIKELGLDYVTLGIVHSLPNYNMSFQSQNKYPPLSDKVLFLLRFLVPFPKPKIIS